MNKMLVICKGYNPGHDRKTNWINRIFNSHYEITFLSLNELENINIFIFKTVFIHTSLESATENQLNIITTFYYKEDKTLFFLHEASIFDKKNTDFLNCIGARFQNHETYQTIKIEISNSYIHKALDTETFSVNDELYYFNPEPILDGENDKVILTEHKTKKIIGYMKCNECNSKAIYISLGHDDGTLENETFKRILCLLLTMNLDKL